MTVERVSSRPRLSYLEIAFIIALVIMFFNYLYWMLIYSEPVAMVDGGRSLGTSLFRLFALIVYECLVICGIVGAIRGSACLESAFASFMVIYFVLSLVFIEFRVGVPVITTVLGIFGIVPYFLIIICAIYLTIVYMRPPYSRPDITLVYQL